MCVQSWFWHISNGVTLIYIDLLKMTATQPRRTNGSGVHLCLTQSETHFQDQWSAFYTVYLPQHWFPVSKGYQFCFQNFHICPCMLKQQCNTPMAWCYLKFEETVHISHFRFGLKIKACPSQQLGLWNVLQKAFTSTVHRIQCSAVQSNVKRLQGIEIGKVPFASVAAVRVQVDQLFVPGTLGSDADFSSLLLNVFWNDTFLI